MNTTLFQSCVNLKWFEERKWECEKEGETQATTCLTDRQYTNASALIRAISQLNGSFAFGKQCSSMNKATPKVSLRKARCCFDGKSFYWRWLSNVPTFRECWMIECINGRQHQSTFFHVKLLIHWCDPQHGSSPIEFLHPTCWCFYLNARLLVWAYNEFLRV